MLMLFEVVLSEDRTISETVIDWLFILFRVLFV
jgi:hypothetical protein